MAFAALECPTARCRRTAGHQQTAIHGRQHLQRWQLPRQRQQWEPRILLTNVTVTPGEDPSLVWIEIAYVRRADRRPDNLVYPFYLSPG